MNLPARFNEPSSLDYHKVHIRGICFNISSIVISSFLGRSDSPPLGEAHPSTENLVLELTGDTKRAWPSSGQLCVATLSVKYAILNKIGIANWCPSTLAFLLPWLVFFTKLVLVLRLTMVVSTCELICY